MNREMDAPGLLRSAARLVERALGQLNAARRVCPECSVLLYEDKDQGRVHEQFAETPRKLREAANRLDNATADDDVI